MKSIALIALLLSAATASAPPAPTSLAQLDAHGIDKEDLITGHQWRRAWPYGIDTGEDDSDVLNMRGGASEKKKKKEDELKYPWSYDDDVVKTQASIKSAETQQGVGLRNEAVTDGGLHLLDGRIGVADGDVPKKKKAEAKAAAAEPKKEAAAESKPAAEAKKEAAEPKKEAVAEK